MSAPIIVTPTDLAIYLGLAVDSINMQRAYTLIGYARSLCESIINPLPAGAEPVVLDVAARAYRNPSNVQSEATGPYNATYGQAAGGLWLTRTNETTLRRLAGRGGAFSIDTLPATAGQYLPPWDRGGLFIWP